MLCTDGPSGLDDERRAELAASGIDVREEPVTGLESRGGTLTAVLLDGGQRVECDGLFFATGQRQASLLPAKIGSHFTSKGAVATGTRETTDVPGLFVAGDAS